MAIAKSAVGVVLTLLGLALAGVGIWFGSHLGASGTATFTATSFGPGPVVLEPSLINHVSLPVRVTVTPARGDTAWVALGAPSDVRAAIGSTPATHATGVTVRDWVLNVRRTGKGEAAALTRAEMWRSQVSGTATTVVTVEQSNAPETMVITGGTQPPSSVAVSWSRQTWFFQSLVMALVGVMVAGVGLGALVGQLRSRSAPSAPADEPVGAMEVRS